MSENKLEVYTLKNNNFDDVLDCALKAVNIYNGDFLHENTELSWINQKRPYLRRLYLEEIYIISDLLKEREDFAKIEEVSEQSLIILYGLVFEKRKEKKLKN